MNPEQINFNKIIENNKEKTMKKKESIKDLCFESKKEGASIFWKPRLEGSNLLVTSGKIGTKGKPRTKEFSSNELAEKELKKAVCEKLVQGYIPTDQTVSAMFDKIKQAQNPEAITVIFKADHMSDEDADDFYRWLTAFVQFGMSTDQFKRAWRKLEDNDEDAIRGIETDSNKIAQIYNNVVKQGADRFAWYNDNAVINMVALRGDPGAKAIENLVTDIDVNKFDWPEELGVNKPIKSLGTPSHRVSLRSGEEIRLAEKTVKKDEFSIEPEVERPEGIFKDLNKAMKKRSSGSARFNLNKLITNLAEAGEPARQAFVPKLAGLLSWPEEKFIMVDSVKFQILHFIARFGDESAIEAIEKYAENGEEYQKEAARRTIEVIRYPQGRENHPNFKNLEKYIKYWE